MSFVFPAMLGGLVLVGVPILLHLIIRQKPKHLLFPAFRFLLQRHKTNQRKLRLRHLLLLALRVLLIAAVVLAVTRPKTYSERAQDGPVAAVLLIDTSPSMDYEVEDQRGPAARPEEARRWTLLEEAKRRARELLATFHRDSRVAVLDTARPNKVWLSPAKAEQRLKHLKVRPDNFTVTDRLADAYALLELLSRDGDEALRNLPRFVYVFSDRTQGCWDGRLLKRRQEEADRIPPPGPRLQDLPDRIPPLLDLLASLRERLQLSPGPGLIDQLKQLRDAAGTAGPVEYTDSVVARLLAQVRGQVRELLPQVQALGDRVPAEAREYRDKLVGQLQGFLRDFRGAYEVFVDVGLDTPLDLAVENLELPTQIDRDAPRQVFWANEQFEIRAVVRATGAPYDAVVHCLVDGKKVAEKLAPELKPGPGRVLSFCIDCRQLKRGLHQVEVTIPRPLDKLRFDDRRFVTFLVGEARKVLTVADRPEDASFWAKAVDASGEFQCQVVSAGEFARLTPARLRAYKAVCLFQVVEPSAKAWNLLRTYVNEGGGLVVVPPRDEKSLADSRKAYDTAAAQDVLPGKLVRVVTHSPVGVVWDWQPSTFQGLLKPFQKWVPDLRVDFVKIPRRAERYWEVEPKEKGGDVLVRYKDRLHHPALLETRVPGAKARGKVLLFTTPLDGRQGWNNYMQLDSAFCVILPHLTMRYLAGGAETASLNFLSGQPVRVSLPLSPRRPPYSVEGPVIEDAPSTLEVPPTQGELTVRGATQPGNYPILDSKNYRVAGFSVNLPPAECDLTKVPEDQIAALFGPKSVVPVGGEVTLGDALQGRWGRPVELLPLLLILVLFFLVVESLLANRFYRRDTSRPPEQPRGTEGQA